MSHSPEPLPTVDPPHRLGGGDLAPVHIVLVSPEIPPNTGNVARLCAATGAWLHLVEPLGFALDHRKVKRAGLDYWPDVRLSVHASLSDLIERLVPERAHWFTTHAQRGYTDVAYRPGDVLIFGRETSGLGEELRERYAERLVRIPIKSCVRSLNLSNAVAIATYEVLRQTKAV